MTTRQAVHPASSHALYKLHGYSPAIRSGDLLFVSGMVGARPDGTQEPELKDEMALAYESLRGVLAAAGCTFDDIVDVTYFMTEPQETVDLLVGMIRSHFPAEPKPNVTAVGVTWLAGFRFEIKVIARIPAPVTAAS
jgi:enamine deaminase RidA (YjgF/YER057c/UK114 family)